MQIHCELTVRMWHLHAFNHSGISILKPSPHDGVQGISSTDIRSEVRNCAVRTLFAVVVSQGNRMSSELWDECLWEILFPLLRSVHHMSVTSSREEVI